MATTFFEKGELKGRREGELTGQLRTLQIQLEARFGPVSPELLTQLGELAPDKLDELTRAILKAQSLADLGLKS